MSKNLKHVHLEVDDEERKKREDLNRGIVHVFEPAVKYEPAQSEQARLNAVGSPVHFHTEKTTSEPVTEKGTDKE